MLIPGSSPLKSLESRAPEMSDASGSFEIGGDFQEALGREVLLKDALEGDREAASAHSALLAVAAPAAQALPVPGSAAFDAAAGTVKSPLKPTAEPVRDTAQDATQGLLSGAVPAADKASVAPGPASPGHTPQKGVSPDKAHQEESVLPSILRSLTAEGVDLSALGAMPGMDFAVEELRGPGLREDSATQGLENSLEDAGEASETPGSRPRSGHAAGSRILSTSDFLGLHGIGKRDPSGSQEGERDSGRMFSSRDRTMPAPESGSELGTPVLSSFSGMMHNPSGLTGSGPVIEAPVTRNAAGRMALQPEATEALAGRVGQLSQARQDGEIKIRLRPDHLGELIMNVRTQGQQVAIQIKAKEGESKKIIEESLSALKESLSQQNLTLSKVEVSSASLTQSQDFGPTLDSGAQRQGFGGQPGGFSGSERDQGTGQERRFEEPARMGNLNGSRQGRPSRAVGSSGLDLIA